MPTVPWKTTFMFSSQSTKLNSIQTNNTISYLPASMKGNLLAEYVPNPSEELQVNSESSTKYSTSAEDLTQPS